MTTDVAMRPEIAAHVARKCARPLGSRQGLILAYVRMRIAGGQPFPTESEIKEFIGYGNGISDIHGSLLGLQVRGIIRSTARVRTRRGTKAAGWEITEEGWQA